MGAGMTEREAIVAWLRKEAAGFHEKSRAYLGRNFAHYAPLAKNYRIAADAIERGQHLENKDG